MLELSRDIRILTDACWASGFYCLGIPIGLWFAFQQHWGLFGPWWGLAIGMAWAVILGSYFCVSTDWQKEVKRVMARLAVDNGYQQGLRDEEYAYAGGSNCCNA